MLSREYRFGKDHVLEVAPTWFLPVAWCYDSITSTAEFVITDRLSFIAVNLSRNDIESIWQFMSAGTLDQAISSCGKIVEGYYTINNEEVQQYSSGGKVVKVSDAIIQALNDNLHRMRRF